MACSESVFEFYTDYDAENGGRVLLNENDVECVALLSNRNADKKGYITLDVNLDDYYRIKNDGSIKD
mgnify:CR=1 FL=1